MEYRCITNSNNSWMIQDYNLGCKFTYNCWWVINMSQNISSRNILLTNTSNIESNVISWFCLSNLLVMHFYTLNFTIYSLSFSSWSNDNFVSNLHNSSFNSSYWNYANTSNVIDILNWQS